MRSRRIKLRDDAFLSGVRAVTIGPYQPAAILVAALMLLGSGASATDTATYFWAAQPTPQLDNPTTVVDSVGNQLLVFGGSSGGVNQNTLWIRPLGNSGVWRHADPVGSAPTARSGAAAVIAPGERVLTIIGGAAELDVWRISADAPSEWVSVPVAGDLPPPDRLQAYPDLLQNRVVVVRDQSIWTLTISDSARFHLVPAAVLVTPAHTGAKSAFDPLSSRVFVHGGDAQSGYDQWILATVVADSLRWSQIGTVGPRQDQTLAYDPVHGELVAVDIPAYNDHSWDIGIGLWTWSPTTQQFARIADVAPAGGWYTGYAVDAGSDRLLALTTNLFAFPLAGGTWGRLDPTEGTPGPCGPSGAALDPRGNRLVSFGGAYFSAPNNDLYVLGLGGVPTWTHLQPSDSLPPARSGCAVIVDPIRDRIIIYGGFNSVTSMNDTWELPLHGTLAWHQLPAVPIMLADGGSGVYDPVHDRMLVVGNGGNLHGMPGLDLSQPADWIRYVIDGDGSFQYNPGAMMTYDPVRDRWLQVYYSMTGLNLDTMQWGILPNTDTTPGAGAAYDPVRDGCVAINFQSQIAYGYDFGVAPPTSEVLTDAGVRPVPRLFPRIVYDVFHDRFVLSQGDVAQSTTVLERGGPGFTFSVSGHRIIPVGARQAFDETLLVSNPFDHEHPYMVMITTSSGVSLGHARARIPAHSIQAIVCHANAPENPTTGVVAVVEEAWAEGTNGWASNRAFLALGPAVSVTDEAGPETALWAESPVTHRGSLAVWYRIAAAGSIRIELLDVSGRVVEQRRMVATAGTTGRADFDLRSRHSGLYWVRLFTNAGTRSAKVVVLR
jgi:hypothetical protein